ncbi:hypothetical protein ACRAWG_27475 [Methylobacterium sp. P31]
MKTSHQFAYEKVVAATMRGQEEAILAWHGQRLVAIFVNSDDGWFLQHSFGASDVEGIIFRDLSDFEAWVGKRIAAKTGMFDKLHSKIDDLP